VKFSLVADDVKLGKNVKIYHFTNLYGCEIGDDSQIGSFVEIQKDSIIGNKCKISSHTFICSGIEIGDNCFIGHGVMFINDNYPQSVNDKGNLEKEHDWADRFKGSIIGNNVAIGSNATILGGLSIGHNSIIGAGAVVTKDVPAGSTIIGNPGRIIKK